MSSKPKNYSEAMEEIEQIIQRIEAEEISIDTLEVELKKAKKLFEYCKKKLKDTQSSIENILND